MKLTPLNVLPRLCLLLVVGGIFGVAAVSVGSRWPTWPPAPSEDQTPDGQAGGAGQVNADGISFPNAAKQKPFPPADVIAVSMPNGIEVKWRANCGDIAVYTVYRKLPGKAYAKVRTQNPIRALENSDAPGQYQFLDKRIKARQGYTYAVTVTSTLGAESDKSETASVAFH